VEAARVVGVRESAKVVPRVKATVMDTRVAARVVEVTMGEVTMAAVMAETAEWGSWQRRRRVVGPNTEPASMAAA